MKKILFFIFLFQTSLIAQDQEKAYFAGGCFWCMEESFEKFEGVSKVISGYSGGSTENPTYEEVTYSNTCLLYTSPSPRDQRGSRIACYE